ncbi:MAG: core-2/I-Branching enzyme [Friedmanniella sp.]|nr:core-2/I-Branching enzyme [Friedmanniella sp.]
MSPSRTTSGLPAVVIVAHDKPQHLHRLVAALDPLPIFLHVDATTAPELFAQMVTGLPDRVTVLPRIKAGWAQFGVLEAELSGYRAALAATDASHIIMATGADYPLAPTSRIIEILAAHPDRSWSETRPLPIPEWGAARGYDRFLLPQRVWRRHRLALPFPRRVPRGIRPGGGAQTKILTRRHAEIILKVVDERPDLVAFFRTCWTPDEVMIPSILVTEAFGANWEEEVSTYPHPWFISWETTRSKNPRWLDLGDLDDICAAAQRSLGPALFARKFSEGSSALTSAIDTRLRHEADEHGRR